MAGRTRALTLPATPASDAASAGSTFASTPERFRELVESALATATRLGATDAVAEASEGVGLSVSVRKGETENIERNRDKSLSITVYVGQRRGNASTSSFAPEAIEQTVRAAHDIARFTAEDPAAGLPEADDLVTAEEAARDLSLFHPWAIDAERALELALSCEAAAFAVDPRISNSEGAGVSAQQSHFWAGNTRGFSAGFPSSRHSISVAPIAVSPRSADDMQRDAWYTSMRAPEDLADTASVGRYAAQRALSRLGSRKIRTCRVPVLFESTLASGLLGSYVQAVSGGALYRKTTFLPDALGQPVWAPHIDVEEDPHIARGKGSAPFDDEGVRTRARRVVAGGVCETWFLSTYSARKLGVRTTGHAGGAHNLVLRSRLTAPGDDLDAMLRKLDRGLFVIELMGQGVNPVTGDYSRGAAGFWVEKGRIVHPVHEVTIAGNLKDMLKGVVAVGADAFAQGSRTSGSILVERMQVAGA
jgi:PmbA protein